LYECAVSSKPDKDLADLIVLYLTDLNILDVKFMQVIIPLRLNS